MIYYGRKHFDYDDVYKIYIQLEELNDLINEKLPLIENKQKLIELQKDLVCVDNLSSAKIYRVRFHSFIY